MLIALVSFCEDMPKIPWKRKKKEKEKEMRTRTGINYSCKPGIFWNLPLVAFHPEPGSRLDLAHERTLKIYHMYISENIRAHEYIFVSLFWKSPSGFWLSPLPPRWLKILYQFFNRQSTTSCQDSIYGPSPSSNIDRCPGRHQVQKLNIVGIFHAFTNFSGTKLEAALESDSPWKGREQSEAEVPQRKHNWTAWQLFFSKQHDYYCFIITPSLRGA